MKIQQITEKKSIGILYYITCLNQELQINFNYVSLKNWADINLFEKYDISHYHLSNSTRGIILTFLLFKSKIKIVTIHDIIPRTNAIPLWFTKSIYRYLNLFADQFIVHSEFAKKLLFEIAPYIPQNKVSVIAHGCTVLNEYNTGELREKYGFLKSDIILLIVGFIKKNKGQLEVINVFRKINLKNVKLIIIGRTIDKESEIEFQNITDENIFYLGFVDNETLLDYIKLSDALINFRLESVGESSGPILIAMGSGKPIICSKVGSFPEIIKDAGIVVESQQKLEETIIKFSTDNETRKRLKENAERIREDYSWKNSAKKHMDIYKRLVHSKEPEN